MQTARVVLVIVTALGLSLPACRSREPLRATSIQLGRALNPDKTVSGHTTRFKTTDTVYAAVLTTGSGSGTLSARWIYVGRVVSEPRQDVSYRGDAATEFHLQNSSGLPPGSYAVELFLNGKPVGSRDFRIEK